MEAEAASPRRELELSEVEAEKRPMAAEEEEEEEGGAPAPPEPAPPGGEKNGLVKIPQDEESGGAGISGGCKFTGLGKEELLQAAGAPGWAKARTLLLLLFWLGWLGMLGAAVAIVVRAPRCRPLPPRSWWQLGGLYRAPPQALAGQLKGMEARLEHVAGLQMRGLVLGPLHPQSRGAPQNLSLEELDPALGSLSDFAELLQAAKKKGLQVLVDLTPNPWGGEAWFGREVAESPAFREKVKRALSTWLDRGVAGVFLDGIEELQPSVVAEWRNLTEQSSPDGVPRVLVGGTRLRDPAALQRLLNNSGAGVVLVPFLELLDPKAPDSARAPQLLQFLREETPLAWSMGSPRRHLGGQSPPHAPQHLLLLWAALPGTPVLGYGDEVALGQQLTRTPWEVIDAIREGDNSTEARQLELCRRLGALWAREPSLSLGEAEAIEAGPAAAFLRSWEQSERFLVVLNPGGAPIPRLALEGPALPPQATLRLSTHRPVPQDPQLKLRELELLPYEGLLLSFPPTP